MSKPTPQNIGGPIVLSASVPPPAPRYTRRMADMPIVLEPDPVIEAYKKDIDRTLLRENLKLTPAERLQKLQSVVHSLVALRDAAKKSRR